MEISTREAAGGVIVLDLQGDLAPDPGETELRDAVAAVLEDGYVSILLNFADVPYVSSAGLGEMVRCFQRAADAGAALKIENLQPPVRDLMRLVRIDQVVETFETEEDAVVSFVQ